MRDGIFRSNGISDRHYDSLSLSLSVCQGPRKSRTKLILQQEPPCRKARKIQFERQNRIKTRRIFIFPPPPIFFLFHPLKTREKKDNFQIVQLCGLINRKCICICKPSRASMVSHFLKRPVQHSTLNTQTTHLVGIHRRANAR